MKTDANPWKTITSREVYDNPWISVTEHKVINPSGGDGIYGVVHFKNIAIGVVPIDEEGNTWIVGQYRYPLNTYSWEIPEGGGNPSVPPEETARRELLEETGIAASEITPLLSMHLSNSATDEFAQVFLARGLTFGESNPEETEQLLVRKIPFTGLYDMVCRGEITDSLTVAAVLKLRIMILEGALQA